jgi:hypothetical protein
MTLARGEEAGCRFSAIPEKIAAEGQYPRLVREHLPE